MEFVQIGYKEKLFLGLHKINGTIISSTTSQSSSPCKQTKTMARVGSRVGYSVRVRSEEELVKRDLIDGKRKVKRER